MRKFLRLRQQVSVLMILAMMLTMLTPVYASTAKSPQIPVNAKTPVLSENGEYIVKSRPGAVRTRVNSALTEARAGILKERHDKTLVKISKEDANKALTKLMASSDIEYVEPNLRLKKASTVDVASATDSLRSEQWGLDHIAAPTAWTSLSSTLAPVTVAVIDTGVDYTHPDLQGAVDTANGYDFVNTDGDAMDDEGHGTHVAGIIAAQINNQGMFGVAAPAQVKILPVKALDASGLGSTYDIANAIQYAADKGAKVINLSLGGPGYTQTMADAVAYAVNKGVVVVAAAGNEHDDVQYYSPAALPGVIAVGSVNSLDTISSFSNYGADLDLVAPGENIISTIPKFVYDKLVATQPDDFNPSDVFEENGAYYYKESGTSMATPFVAGVAAMVKAHNSALSYTEISNILRSSATDLGSAGFDQSSGYGLLNAGKAIAQANSPSVLQSIKINYPTEGQQVWGKVYLGLEVTDAHTGQQVNLSVYQGSTEIKTTAIPLSEDVSIYSYQLDTTTLPSNGVYRLQARVDDSLDLVASVNVDVRNQVTNGLQFHILNPDGTPAAQASVTLVHKGYWGAQDAQEAWYDVIYEEYTDQEGNIRIPGSIAVDGNDFEVFVLSHMGSEGDIPVVYHQPVKGPGLQTIDGTKSHRINLNLEDKQGNPIVDGDIGVGFYDTTGYSQWSLPVGLTDSTGKLAAYIDDDKYRFHAIAYGAPDGNDYLLTKDVTVNSADQQIYFDGETGLLDVNYDGSKYQGASLYLDEYGMGLAITNNKSVVVTSGQYYPGVSLIAQGGTDTWDYYYVREQGLSVNPNLTTNLKVGNNVVSTIVPDSLRIDRNSDFTGISNFQDDAANRLIDVSLYSLGPYSNKTIKFSHRGKDGHTQLLKWDAGIAGVHVALVPYFSTIEPELSITKDNTVVDQSVGWQNYFEFWWTARVPSGSYKAQMCLDAGPLGQINSVPVTFEVLPDDTISPTVAHVYDVYGNPAQSAYYSVWETAYEDSGYSFPKQVFGWNSDVNGAVDLSQMNLAAGKQYRLLVMHKGAGIDDPRVLYSKTITSQSDLSVVDLSETVPAMLTSDIQGRIFLSTSGGNGAPEITMPLVDLANLDPGSQQLASPVRLLPGTYNFALVKQGDSSPGSQTGYYLTKANVNISAAASNTVELSSLGTVNVSVYNKTTNADVDLFLCSSSSQEGFFYRAGNGWKVKVTPDTYQFAYELYQGDNEGKWDYSLGDEKAYQVQNDQILQVGGNYQGDLGLDTNAVKPGEHLTGQSSFRDEFGNRLAGISVSPAYFSQMGEYAFTKGANGKRTIINTMDGSPVKDMQNQSVNDLIAPILSIYDSQGTKLANYKDWNHFWDIDYNIPEQMGAGNYRAELELGVFPQGLVTAKSDFSVVNTSSSSSGGFGGGGGGGTITTQVNNSEAEKGAAEFVGTSARDVDLNLGATKFKVPGGALDVQSLQELLKSDPSAKLVFSSKEVTPDNAGLTNQLRKAKYANLKSVGKVYDFGLVAKSGSKEVRISNFSKKIKVGIPYQDSDLNGANAQTLSAYRITDQGLEDLNGQVDTVNRIVWFETASFSNYTLAVKTAPFADIVAHWAKDDIQKMFDKGVVKGTNGNDFAPGANVTRAEFAAMLVRALGLTEIKAVKGTFKDVGANAWYYTAVETAAGNGVVIGDKGRFNPLGKITRQEMAMMIARSMKTGGKQVTLTPTEAAKLLEKFGDRQQIAAWAQDSVALAVKEQIVNGRTENTYVATAKASRAEGVVMVRRLLTSIGKL